jgi:hypothetical protein
MHTNKSHDMYIDIVDLDNVNDSDCIYIYTYIYIYIYLKNSLIIQEENTKKNHKRVVSLYVIKNHVNLHKL